MLTIRVPEFPGVTIFGQVCPGVSRVTMPSTITFYRFFFLFCGAHFFHKDK